MRLLRFTCSKQCIVQDEGTRLPEGSAKESDPTTAQAPATSGVAAPPKASPPGPTRQSNSADVAAGFSPPAEAAQAADTKGNMPTPRAGRSGPGSSAAADDSSAAEEAGSMHGQVVVTLQSVNILSTNEQDR